MKPTTSPYIEVRDSSIHHTGIFAAKDIPEGAKVMEYVGERITKKESDKRAEAVFDKSNNHQDGGGVYIFEINKKFDIDGNVDYNTARFINHSCDPNCETDIIDERIWIIAIRDIKKGEEILYDYGYGMDEWEEHPCWCCSYNCMGYIVSEDLWPKLRRNMTYQKLMAKQSPKRTPKNGIIVDHMGNEHKVERKKKKTFMQSLFS